MNRYVCIHGHFYQPPRENPWLEAVELQQSAYPYHDWNERVCAECYGPNSASRVLSPGGPIIDIMNNYSRISFNFGPTLLAWMEEKQPEVYAAILEADRHSIDMHEGHGSALAQVYSHMIMPLANSRDKRSQVRWGLADFARRFGRRAEGMWLAETAVDLETLELLAEHDVRFTILAPRQAARVRRLGGKRWIDVGGERIDPRRPYLCRLASGREITLFFYDGPIAREIAFGGLLHNGEAFAQRLLDTFDDSAGPQLVHVATDGETYGHHHRRGEMALTYCLHHIESQQLARVVLYGQYLDAFPPTHEVEIFERSSWSCEHGVERWCSDCGCNSQQHPGWGQSWRAPLRDSLDWLRDELARVYETHAAPLLIDPWTTRDAYIDVILERAPDNVRRFLSAHAGRDLDDMETTRALQLLELQRHALLMFTSCGWFFDEISGIETTQIIQYASRAIQLARGLTGRDLEPGFVQRLARASSNLPEHEHGARIYDKFVRPAQVSLLRVGAHYAVSSLFQDFDADDRIYCYDVHSLGAETHQAGKTRLAIGRMRVRSVTTWEQGDLSYAVLHLGDQNVNGGVRPFVDVDKFARMRDELRAAFGHGDVPESVLVLARHFEDDNYSLWHLFRDQQHNILASIFEEAETRIENFYRQVYQEHYHLLHLMVDLATPLPSILRATAEFVLNRDLRSCLEDTPVDRERFEAILEDVDKLDVAVDTALLGLIGSQQLDQLVTQLTASPLDEALLTELERSFRLYARLDAPLNLWRSQNTLYEIGRQQFFLRSKMAERGEDSATQWVQRFKRVATLFDVRFEG